MVSSTVPRLEDRWPPVWLTDSRMKVRSSSASRRSPRRSRARRAAGSSIVFSSSYAAGSYSLDPVSGLLPGRSAFPIALIRANYPANWKSLSEANWVSPQLEFAQHDEIGKLGEPSGAALQVRQRGLRLFAQFLGEPSRACEPERRDVGRLVVRRVLAYGLAERRGRGLLVQNVVDHLKSEADAFRVVVEARKCPGASAFEQRAPSATDARISAPVLWMCMYSSSGTVRAWPTLARSIACPPAMPRLPHAAASIFTIST